MKGHPNAADSFLARLACERARVLAPLVLIGQLVSFATSERLGMALTPLVIGFNLVSVTVNAVLAVLLMRRRLPVHWAHLALVTLWWCAVGGTLISQYCSGRQLLALIVLVEFACIAASLDTTSTIFSIAIAAMLYVPMVIRDTGPDAPIYLTTLGAASLFAIVVQILMRRSLVSGEVHRIAEADTACQLARQLAEIERSKEERQRLQDQLAHAQRMEAVGTLAGGVAHDMNNVLAAITSYANLLLDDVPHAARSDLGQILTQAERGGELTRGLLAFSRRGQYRKQVVTFDEVVRDVVPLLGGALPKGIALTIELGAGDARIDGDRVQLGQTIVNFSINAADAMGGDGTLVIRSERVELDAAASTLHDLAPGRYVRVRVTDTGTGMDEATRSRVFEPFFTTKAMGKGTGLGLSMVWGILKAHDGAVGVDSRLGEGSTFWLLVPETTQPLQSQPAAPAGVATTGAIVLLIDDEPAVRESGKRLLERRGHRVLCAENGAEGLRVFDAHADAIQLVVLDMGMPVMGGAECFELLRERSSVPVLITTGYAIDAQVQELVKRGASLIEKPYALADLSREVARLVSPVET